MQRLPSLVIDPHKQAAVAKFARDFPKKVKLLDQYEFIIQDYYLHGVTKTPVVELFRHGIILDIERELITPHVLRTLTRDSNPIWRGILPPSCARLEL